MIAPGTELHIVVVRLSQIVVTQCQERFPERALHYYRLLSDPAHAGHHAGVVHLAPYGVNSATHEPLYTLLDGHHRFCAAILCGRETLLGVLHIAPAPVVSIQEQDDAPRAGRETVALADEGGFFNDYETLALLPAVAAGAGGTVQ